MKNFTFTKNLAAICIFIIGLLLQSTNVWSQSKKTPAKSVTALEEKLANEMYEQGVNEVIKGEYKKAIKTFQKVIDLNPKHTESYRQLGMVYSEIKDYGSAIEAYLKLTKIKPKEEDGYWLLAEAYEAVSFTKEATGVYRKIIGLGSVNPTVYYKMGQVEIQNTNFKNAVTMFSKSVQYDSTFIDGYYYVGLSYLYMQDPKYYKPAIKSFEKLLKIDSLHAMSYYYLAIVYDAMQNEPLANYYYSKAKKIDPSMKH